MTLGRCSLSIFCSRGTPPGVFGVQILVSQGLHGRVYMCSGSEAGSYLRLIDFVYHSTLGLRVIKKKKIHGGSERGIRD